VDPLPPEADLKVDAVPVTIQLLLSVYLARRKAGRDGGLRAALPPSTLRFSPFGAEERPLERRN
jgi:hypothetical protein